MAIVFVCLTVEAQRYVIARLLQTVTTSPVAVGAKKGCFFSLEEAVFCRHWRRYGEKILGGV
jgi:hypothetical protein